MLKADRIKSQKFREHMAGVTHIIEDLKKTLSGTGPLSESKYTRLVAKCAEMEFTAQLMNKELKKIKP